MSQTCEECGDEMTSVSAGLHSVRYTCNECGNTIDINDDSDAETIADNPINLRFATEKEIENAKILLDHEFLPDFYLASDTAFPGNTALYRGIDRDGDGIIDSAGYIGNMV